MKKLIFVLIFANVAFAAFAQDKSDIGKIALSVVLPDNIEKLDAGQMSKIQTKISQIVTNSGIAASGYNNNFIIYPKFAIYETEVVETGMQNITVVNAELSLFIKQVENNVLFATMSKKIKGSGKNAQAAITNAISAISPNDAQYKTFIQTGKNKIVQYYESKCQDIMNKSQSLANMKEYAQAVGLLMTVPDEVSCYQKIQTRLVELYKLYQDKQCIKDIQDAKIELAANNYKAALRILSQIDPSAACFGQVQGIVKSMETKIDEEDKRIWDAQMKMYSDKVELEKYRMNAIKDIAVAYYQSQTKPASYNYLIVD
jgi:hypothetical protein